MRRNLFAFLSGGLFSAGLTLGGMTQPHKVRSFLDFTGHWDPSLAFVMVGAIGVYALLYRLGTGRAQPWHNSDFVLPTKRHIDASLLTGAGIFGVGWGLVGLCPGPALAALATGSGRVFVFFAAMLSGMWLVRAGRQLTHEWRAPPLPSIARDS
ncbi:MAG: DUF6691 family protein [Deltaproteobacteria bacterium]